MRTQPAAPDRANRTLTPVRLSWQLPVAIAGVQLLIFLFYVLTELHQNGKLGFPLDDPWIHLTFARNLARGWGFAFNHGEPVQGSSAPLWTVILALFHLFTKSVVAMVWIAKILGATFLYVAGLFACRLVFALTRRRWAGLVAGLVLVTFSHFDWAMASGMEVTLCAALVLAGTYYHLVPQRGGRQYLSWVLFALAVYVRPESFLLPVFLIADIIIRRLAFRQKIVFWRGLAVCGAAIVPYFVLNLALAHSVFPQTYIAKVGRTSLFTALATGDTPQIGLLLFKAPLLYLGGFVTHLWRGNPVLVLLALVGLCVLVVHFVKYRGQASLLIPLVVLFFVGFVGMTAPFVHPIFQSGRYLGPAVALAVVTSVLGAEWILRQVRQRAARLAVGSVLAILALFNAVSTGIATAGNTARAENSINRQQVALGEWLAQNTPEDAVIACNDVGAIGYFANRRVLDLLGLVTPEVMSYRKKYPIGRENFAGRDFVLDRKPDYLVIFPSWFPNLEKTDFLKPVYGVDLPDNYASQYDFEPRLKTFAWIFVTGLELEPVRAVMVVYRCDWNREKP
jgi:arabinofuranosyltransferase